MSGIAQGTKVDIEVDLSYGRRKGQYFEKRSLRRRAEPVYFGHEISD